MHAGPVALRTQLTLLCLLAVVPRRVLTGRVGPHLGRLTHERHRDRRAVEQREPRRPAPAAAADDAEAAAAEAGLARSTAAGRRAPAEPAEEVRVVVMMAAGRRLLHVDAPRRVAVRPRLGRVASP